MEESTNADHQFERERIALVARRDGEPQARAWVERTLGIYRAALDTGGYAADPRYRPRFEASIRVFEEWLAERGA